MSNDYFSAKTDVNEGNNNNNTNNNNEASIDLDKQTRFLYFIVKNHDQLTVGQLETLNKATGDDVGQLWDKLDKEAQKLWNDDSGALEAKINPFAVLVSKLEDRTVDKDLNNNNKDS